jgi:O-antigen/teichoic acid export membrane protein
MHLRVVLRNIFSNWTSYVVTAVIGFVLAPIVVHSLGATGYGLWTLVVSLTGYFGLLDLGIRSSVGRFVARYMALHDEDKVNRTVSTAFAILAAGGLLALLATVAVVTLFFGNFKVEPQYLAAGRTALLITGINVACILPLGIFSAVLIALDRFDILSGINIAVELMRAVLMVILLTRGHGVVAMACVGLLLTAIQYTAVTVAAKLLHRSLRVSWRLVDRSSSRELFGFGIYRFIWIVANQLIFYSDSVVIGVFLSASAITYFAIGGSLIAYGRTVVSLVTDTLVPTAARLDAKQDVAGLRKLLISGTMMALMVAAPVCLGFWFLGKQFIELWMGRQYVSSAVFLIVLTIPQLGSMSQYVSGLILAGMAKHKMLAYLVLCEGVANLLLSIFLVRKIGLIGVAWGTVIPSLIFTSILVPAYTLRTLGMSAREYIAKAILRPLLCAIPVAGLAYALSVLVADASWAVFGLEAAAICLAYGALAYFFCLSSGQRTTVVDAVISMIRRREAVAHGA